MPRKKQSRGECAFCGRKVNSLRLGMCTYTGPAEPPY